MPIGLCCKTFKAWCRCSICAWWGLQKYALFGINVFEYASVFDYLIAPFNNPQIMLFTLGSLLFCGLVIWSNLWMAKRFKRLYTWMWLGLNNKSWFGAFSFVTFLALILVYVWLASLAHALVSWQSFNTTEPIEVVFADGESKQGKLIGKTQSYLFLHADERIKVVPVTAAVKRLVLKEPKMLQEKIQGEQKKAK